MKCRAIGCDRTDKGKKRFYKSHSLCGMHYQRMCKYGNPSKQTIYDRRSAVVEGDYIKIPLGINAKDGFAILDKEFLWLEKYNWCIREHGYAVSCINKKHTRLHHLIIGCPLNKKSTDHINRNPLDNRRSNLRITTQSQNVFNAKLRSDNTSGHKGVSYCKNDSVWRVTVGQKELRRCKTLEEAILARKQALAMKGIKYA